MLEHSSDEYRAAVARALTGADDEAVFNGTLNHARVVIEEAFKAADRYVRVLAHQLSPQCYDSDAVIEAATAFLAKPESRLDLLVEAPERGAGTGKFFTAIKKIGGARVRLLAVPKEIQEGYAFNFLVVDDQAYRYEADRTRPIAVVAGGQKNKATAEHLSGLFDRLFGMSRSIPLDLVAPQG